MKKTLQSALLVSALALTGCGDSNDVDITDLEDVNGFVASRLPENMNKKDTVFVFAPKNCPREAGQRADELVRLLKDQGLDVARRHSFNYSASNLSEEEIGQVKVTMKILKGTVPIVFINGRGKANPTADEVVAVYEETTGE